MSKVFHMWKKLLKMWKSGWGYVEKKFGVWKTMWKKCGKAGGKVGGGCGKLYL